MIEISFNRSVKILANKVYRIGMVLNKVRKISLIPLKNLHSSKDKKI